jgi:tRNA1(Val) A37 N6-methylase TrmN6
MRVLDIGCGCGGLGSALQERFGIRKYSGVEINSKAYRMAKVVLPAGIFFQGDFLAMPIQKFEKSGYHAVISLSCIDWNIEFKRMFAKAWKLVRPGGYLVISLRLTAGRTVQSIQSSYQYINFQMQKKGEKAPYHVLNAREVGQKFSNLNPSRLMAYGYWGKPSDTACTPFTKVCFSVFALQKKPERVMTRRSIRYRVRLPPLIKRLLQKGFATNSLSSP